MQLTFQPISTRLLDNLSRVALLSNLPTGTIREISDYVQMRTISAGQTLYTPDQPADALYLLFQGAIKLYRLSDAGKMAITAILQPGELFGEMAFFRDSIYENFAEAATDVEVGIIPHSEAQLLLQHGEIAQRIIRVMASRVNQLEFQLTAIALKPVSERVTAILLYLYRQLKDFAGSTPEIYITHEELAHMTGANRESVTKVLNDLQSQGIVALYRGHIALLRMDLIRSSCQGNVI